MGRLQLGFEIETNESDWRIREVAACPGQRATVRSNVTDHYLVGILPGIERFENDGGAWGFSISASFRQVQEPSCVPAR